MEDARKQIIRMVKKMKDKQVTWKTHTSIFIGLSPTKLNSTVCDEKGPHVPVLVWNPIEKRMQEEKLRLNKAHGIVLRRTPKYGWASQPYHMKSIDGVFARDISSDTYAPKKKLSFMKTFDKMVQAIRETIKTPVRTRPFPRYEKGQLRMRNLRAICSALWNMASQVDGEFKFIARVYGGNVTRHGVTFKHLRDAFGVDKVPEQYGDGYSTYNPTMIIGYEKRKNGEEVYLRLVKGDLPVDCQKML